MPSQDKLARNAKRLGLRVETYKNIREGRILALADINGLMIDKDGLFSRPSTSFAQRNGSVTAEVMRSRYQLSVFMIDLAHRYNEGCAPDRQLHLQHTGPHFDEKATPLSIQGEILLHLYHEVAMALPQTNAMKETYKNAIARNMVGGVALLKQGRQHHG